jgi:hypothetical protein
MRALAIMLLALAMAGCTALGFGSPPLSPQQAQAVGVAHDALASVASDLAASTADTRALAYIADAQEALDLLDAALTEGSDTEGDLLRAIDAIELAARVLQREGVALPDRLAEVLMLARFAVVVG